MRQDSALPGVAVGAGGWGLPRIAVNQEPHHCSLFLVVLVVAVDFLVVIMLMLMAIGLVLVLSSVIIVLALVVVSSCNISAYSQRWSRALRPSVAHWSPCSLDGRPPTWGTLPA